MNGVTKNDQKEIFYPMDDFKIGTKWFKMVKNLKKGKNLQFLITKKCF